MSLIRHNDDISSFRQWFMRLFKLLHRREDDAVGFSIIQPIHQANDGLFAFTQMCITLFILFRKTTFISLNRLLPQKGAAHGKLTVKLIVQIVAVSYDNDSWAFQCFLQAMGIKDHGKRFSTSLRMPEYTAFSVGFSSMLG